MGPAANFRAENGNSRWGLGRVRGMVGGMIRVRGRGWARGRVRSRGWVTVKGRVRVRGWVSVRGRVKVRLGERMIISFRFLHKMKHQKSLKAFFDNPMRFKIPGIGIYMKDGISYEKATSGYTNFKTV